MEGQARRKRIVEILEGSREAVSGAALAKQLGVSRQIIVQDIALLRAVNKNILSTSRGYLLFQQEAPKKTRCFRVCHNREQIGEELNTIVDLGGKVLDVIVAHPVYGEINADLLMTTRQDVKEFIDKIRSKENGAAPLMEISNGVHIHTVAADSEAVLDQIGQALEDLGILWKE